jgi:hypothetical protein
LTCSAFFGVAIPKGPTEIMGNAVMFISVYEAVKQYLAGGKTRPTSAWAPISWLVVYLTDVVKSVIQVDDYKKPVFGAHRRHEEDRRCRRREGPIQGVRIRHGMQCTSQCHDVCGVRD